MPIPPADGSQASLIGNLAAIMGYLHNHFTTNPATQTAWDPLMVAYGERVLNGLVQELYFPDELRLSACGHAQAGAGGLRLFDLVAAAELPDVTALSEADQLPRLRQKFEELHDGAHPPPHRPR